MSDIINSGVATPIQIYGRAPNGQLQAVTTDGAGNISFAGNAVPGGSNTHVQYNNNGAFGGTANFKYDGAVTVSIGSSPGPNAVLNLGASGGQGQIVFFSGTTQPTITAHGSNTSQLDLNGAFQMTALNLPEAAPPSGIASSDIVFGDSTTHTIGYNSNNNGTRSFSGAWVNTNVTPVTVNANVSTVQNLMSASVPAGTLNRVGRSLRIWAAGVYTLPASAGTTTTIAVTLGGVTLLTITDTSLSTGVTNGQFLLQAMATTQTGGASGVLEVHGSLGIELGATGAVADSLFLDTNTAVSSAVDLTAAQTLQVTITFSVASASNTATQRQMVLETVG